MLGRRRPAALADRAADRAPDLASPMEAWRTWLVVDDCGALRLASVMFAATWPPGDPIQALCRPQPYGWPGLVDLGARHRAPHPGCRCGIYGATRPGLAASYLDKAGPLAGEVAWSVIGRVSLWGLIVEAEQGFRATYAYPKALFVPRLRLVPKRSRRAGRLLIDANQVAAALAAYRVPVAVLDTSTAAGCADALASLG